jgi:methionyl aminopeptidase
MTGRFARGALFGPAQGGGILIKSPAELALMREAGRVVAQVLERMRALARPGVTTAELDREADELIRAAGAIASFKGYPNARPGGPAYPAATCISVNEELVHGIPGPRRLRPGDIVSIDVGAIVKGWHGDGAWSFPVGEIGAEAGRLLAATEQSLAAGIAQARPGNRTGDIAAAIQSVVEAAGFSVVREYTSHGVGRQLHEAPQMVNYGKAGRGTPLRAGMTLALEPMVNAGGWETRVLADGWTVVTADGKLSAHFEHTIAITEHGAEVLTLP